MSVRRQLDLTIYEAVDLHYMLTEYYNLLENRRAELIKTSPTTDEWLNKLQSYNEIVDKQLNHIKTFQEKIAKCKVL